MDAIQAIGQVGEVLVGLLTKTDQRLHIGYLCTALLIACWVYRRNPSKRGFFGTMFNRKIWWSNSARLDYKLVLFNGLIKVLFLTQFVTYGLHLAYVTSDFLTASFGPTGAPTHTTVWLIAYTVTITVVGDLSVYWVHRAMHRVPALWAFHSVHHSATTLSPATQLRIHPVELVINNGRAIVMFGLITGSFHHAANGQIELLTLFGANALNVLFFAFGANLRHSHVRLGYWKPLEKIFISPLQHQIHHSTAPEHHNRNFGSKFAIWDLVAGTWTPSQGVTSLDYGLGHKESHQQTLSSALLHPITVHLKMPPSLERKNSASKPA